MNINELIKIVISIMALTLITSILVAILFLAYTEIKGPKSTTPDTSLNHIKDKL